MGNIETIRYQGTAITVQLCDANPDVFRYKLGRNEDMDNADAVLTFDHSAGAGNRWIAVVGDRNKAFPGLFEADEYILKYLVTLMAQRAAKEQRIKDILDEATDYLARRARIRP